MSIKPKMLIKPKMSKQVTKSPMSKEGIKPRQLTLEEGKAVLVVMLGLMQGQAINQSETPFSKR